MFRRIFMSLMLAVALALGGGAAVAQQSGGVDPSSFNEEEIRQFADAWDNVLEVRDEYTQRMQQAEDREEASSLQDQANEEMVEAVRDSGISLETYGQIAQTASNSPELVERINQYRE